MPIYSISVLIWKGIYKSERKEIKLRELVEGQEWEKSQEFLEEHNYAKRNKVWNEDPSITNMEVYNAIKNLKNEKAAGPDGIKAEMYKKLINIPVFMETMTFCMNKIMTGDIPEGWTQSRVILIPKMKSRKLEPKDFRPISITNCSYKIIAEILNKKVV